MQTPVRQVDQGWRPSGFPPSPCSADSPQAVAADSKAPAIPSSSSPGSDHDTVGGGIHAYDFQETSGFPAKPRIINCKIINNYALNAAGGMIARKAGAFLRDCEFRSNTTGGTGFEEYLGGGGFVGVGPVQAVNCVFVGNATTDQAGGGLHSVGPTTLVNCEFFGNSAESAGGAFANAGHAVNCLFAGNEATAGEGGGLMGVAVHGCTFADNKASGLGGGAIHHDGAATGMTEGLALVSNCTFVGNAATGSGSDAHCAGQVTLHDCTFDDATSLDRKDAGIDPHVLRSHCNENRPQDVCEQRCEEERRE